MNTVPAILRLTDFSTKDTASSPEPEVGDQPTADIEFLPTSAPRVSQQELEKAVSLARAEAEARCAEQIQQVREDFERQLARDHLQSADEQATVLVEKITEQLALTGQRLAERLFEKCRPVIGNLAREQAITELIVVLNTIVQTNCTIHVKGPAELLQTMRERLLGTNLKAEWQETADADVSIEFGDTIVETQLSGWFNSLSVGTEDE